jgi:hypothetical protein
MTRKTKREKVEALIRQFPDATNAEIARRAGCCGTHVTNVRREVERAARARKRKAQRAAETRQ